MPGISVPFASLPLSVGHPRAAGTEQLVPTGSL